MSHIRKRASQQRPHSTNETGRRVGMLYLKVRRAAAGRWKKEELAFDRMRKIDHVNYGFNFGENLYWKTYGARMRRIGEWPPLDTSRASTLKPSKRLR